MKINKALEFTFSPPTPPPPPPPPPRNQKSWFNHGKQLPLGTAPKLRPLFFGGGGETKVNKDTLRRYIFYTVRGGGRKKL